VNKISNLCMTKDIITYTKVREGGVVARISQLAKFSYFSYNFGQNGGERAWTTW
jgi:hypothetical protein